MSKSPWPDEYLNPAYESLQRMQNSGIDYVAGRDHRENWIVSQLGIVLHTKQF
jgi:hypothetical protein